MKAKSIIEAYGEEDLKALRDTITTMAKEEGWPADDILIRDRWQGIEIRVFKSGTTLGTIDINRKVDEFNDQANVLQCYAEDTITWEKFGGTEFDNPDLGQRIISAALWAVSMIHKLRENCPAWVGDPMTDSRGRI